MTSTRFATVAINSQDKLIDCCRKSQFYPTNILRPGNLKRTLKKQYNDINASKNLLFAAKYETVDFLEARDGEIKYQQKTTKSPTELESHLLQNHKDPKCRHIFVQAGDSRAPLDCSWDSFSRILAFHQTSPSFLEYVHSFGDSELPKDYYMTGFLSEDSLAVAKDDALNIPELGRSGRELRVSYLLRSVERTSEDGDGWPWRIRQMAVYHSFDFVTGRALWINIKANDLMKETITEAVTELPELKASSLDDLESKFEATLATHLIFLEWCDGNWRSCINDFEADLSKILVKGKTARISQKDESTAMQDTLRRMLSLKSQSTFQTPQRQETQTGSFVSKLQRSMSKLAGREDDTQSQMTAVPTAATTIAPLQTDHMLLELIKCFKDLDGFSFGQLQKLHHMGEQLHEMSLVIQLDAQALRDIKECYGSLMAREDLPEEIRDNCKRSVAQFTCKVERVAKNLEIRLTQLESMKTWLNDGKTLFDGILQFKSLWINKMLAEMATMQSQKMQEIANKTEKETESMQIITFVAFVFLPGTFVATFFQSGLFEWRKGAHSMGDSLKFNWIAFSFFSAICFPLMLIIFAMCWWWLRRRDRLRRESVTGAGEV